MGSVLCPQCDDSPVYKEVATHHFFCSPFVVTAASEDHCSRTLSFNSHVYTSVYIRTLSYRYRFSTASASDLILDPVVNDKPVLFDFRALTLPCFGGITPFRIDLRARKHFRPVKEQSHSSRFLPRCQIRISSVDQSISKHYPSPLPIRSSKPRCRSA